MSLPESPAAPMPPLTLDDLDYELPPELVAQRPVEPRDASRLLLWRGVGRALEDRRFTELPDVLAAGDVLVRNDTRVFPARSYFRRASGGRIEALFLRPSGAEGSWEALLRGRPRAGEVLVSETLGEGWPLMCERALGDGRWIVASGGSQPVIDLLERAGLTPLPPYIHEPLDDPGRYQTTYARATGSAAAPTAGLHFTPELDCRLAQAGVTVETVTLHVGLGTFRPLPDRRLDEVRLHGEEYEVEGATWSRLLEARAEGRRIVAVGTTSMRTLEHLARVAPRPEGVDGALRGETDLFIRPGFEFRAVDALLTNFHLPRTSLLALVMALCGVEETRRLYRHAVAARYRFYSFGDAMLALPHAARGTRGAGGGA